MDLRTRRELTGLRLSAQHIAHPPASTASGTVRWMLAMQAQDLAGALWSVGLRTPGSTADDIRTALADGTIVRSWPMRGTLHLVAPEDLGWMLALTRPRQATWAATRRRDLGITDAHYATVEKVAHTHLSGGRALRRDVLLAEFENAGVPTGQQRGYHLLWNLAQDGVTVFGPMDGTQPTFVLFDEWIAGSRELSDDEALGEFAARYFRSHGPATDRDFAWWSSLTLTDARRAIAIARPASIDRDERTFYLADDVPTPATAVHALPGFDEFVLGYQDRSAPIPEKFAERIVPGNNGIFQPTILDSGLAVGTWKRSETPRRVTVEVQPFVPLSTRTAGGFERAATRYATFLGKALIIR